MKISEIIQIYLDIDKMLLKSQRIFEKYDIAQKQILKIKEYIYLIIVLKKAVYLKFKKYFYIKLNYLKQRQDDKIIQ